MPPKKVPGGQGSVKDYFGTGSKGNKKHERPPKHTKSNTNTKEEEASADDSTISTIASLPKAPPPTPNQEQTSQTDRTKTSNRPSNKKRMASSGTGYQRTWRSHWYTSRSKTFQMVPQRKQLQSEHATSSAKLRMYPTSSEFCKGSTTNGERKITHRPKSTKPSPTEHPPTAS